MPWGIITSCTSVAVGGLMGGIFARIIPTRITDYLSKLFGITSIAIGIGLIGKTFSFSAVILALILGAFIGESLNLESLLENFSLFIIKKLSKSHISNEPTQSNQRFVSVFVLFCFGSFGLIGAMTEGVTGDPSLLITKSILDFFGAATFSSVIGASITLIAFPQLIIYLLIYLLAGWIAPHASPSMIADFMGCGGIISLVVGLRITEIKSMRISSLLPGLILVMPISALWSSFS